ncbi:hypothetical protein TcYC6_0069850 [Trypanosoma cruzi]|uniref:RING-type domain-containing protein n=1 Tax=Trypanosoma cruzi (strain CL Brener) TaxID=353153 RepID=Q4E4Q1_TRYCC|nr:hypothetical protein Tc00.1047053508461.580 [Trypanosoma cruzi]EAN99799.1 hypothetical protein Tc00.1047053508461.580 [Trypanosoma cruzi]KAF8298634.1 hypothetical protein TcYC6_0069850 [Trypanosoma cruzi]RNC49829.1 hypothetical protein TcCL_NonESM00152 [Trypanosoma cruzi]|eukprot:XP_821650.1 hypothetical protein [Trypanosoma cruzi strain CL Brener]
MLDKLGLLLRGKGMLMMISTALAVAVAGVLCYLWDDDKSGCANEENICTSRCCGKEQDGKRGDDQGGHGLCCVCHNATASELFLPCGHLVFCSTCCEKYVRRRNDSCPICRQKYTSLFHVFTN